MIKKIITLIAVCTMLFSTCVTAFAKDNATFETRHFEDNYIEDNVSLASVNGYTLINSKNLSVPKNGHDKITFDVSNTSYSNFKIRIVYYGPVGSTGNVNITVPQGNTFNVFYGVLTEKRTIDYGSYASKGIYTIELEAPQSNTGFVIVASIYGR